MLLTSLLTLPLILAPSDPTLPSGESPPNVLLVVMDDVGVDQLSAYGTEGIAANTPSLDILWSRGMLFGNVWSAPVCSPTRAHLLTGRFGFRTGVGYLTQGTYPPLELDEVGLPELLDAGTDGAYAHASFGKWHLGMNPEVDGILAPNSHGFGYFCGTEGNLVPAHEVDPEHVDFYNFIEITDGSTEYVTDTYVTSRTVDNALGWIESTPEPWFAQVNFHAPHDPWHAPPAELHTVDLSPFATPEENPNAHYRAALEALDAELGRMLASMGDVVERTVVIVVSDNGSPGEVVVPPYSPQKAKTTLFQGGLHVPMIISGPGVDDGYAVCQRPVQTTDLFATILDLAGVDYFTTPGVPSELDSVSLVPYLSDPSTPPLREWLYAERFLPTGPGPYDVFQQAARDERYKVIRGTNLPTRMFDLVEDPFETTNLLSGPLSAEEQRALRQLLIALEDLKPLPTIR